MHVIITFHFTFCNKTGCWIEWLHIKTIPTNCSFNQQLYSTVSWSFAPLKKNLTFLISFLENSLIKDRTEVTAWTLWKITILLWTEFSEHHKNLGTWSSTYNYNYVQSAMKSENELWRYPLHKHRIFLRHSCYNIAIYVRM